MAIQSRTRFEVPFGWAFPRGLVLTGEIAERFERDRNGRLTQKQSVDEVTGLREWVGAVTDPDERKPKRASFELIFLSDYRPVPATPELIPGMRQIELDGLTAEPRVMGQGEFKYLGYQYRATGIVGDTNTPQTATQPRTASAASGSVADGKAGA